MSSGSDTAVAPGGGGASVMETSNFAHVIFQNVGKSFLPQAALECHYTLTPFITPHPKDWVGIFKVGWSSARDYYTFLWSPMPENYTEGSTVHRLLVFQGYYVPRSDGEFYQFCYITHMGEIRGASTPFQFRAATPTGEELLTVEDDGNSDILVVTTKTGLLERRVEEVQQECKELHKALTLLTQERDRLKEEQRQHNQERQHRLREERERAQAGVKQLEQDLLGVTQKAVLKETELDCLRSKLQKVTMERDNLEILLKNERDERELYKSHMRSAELENTKLSAELQMLKAVELNREVTISQYQDEIQRLHAEKKTHPADAILIEQLHHMKEQLEVTHQRAVMLDSELREACSEHERTKAELERVSQEAEMIRASLADAQEECRIATSQLHELRSQTLPKTERAEAVSELEAELQKEVEELKLRLQMAAEHYKEKYRECQRLRRQVTKLTHKQETQSEDCTRSDAPANATQEPNTREDAALPVTENKPEIQESAEDQTSAERGEGEGQKTEGNPEEQQEEGEESSVSVEAELARMEERWREQCVISDNLKLLLADEEQRFRVQLSEKDREVCSLRESLAEVMKEKGKVEEELQARACREEGAYEQRSEVREPVMLRYPLPYPHDSPPLPLVPQQPAELQYGNPYCEENTRDGADGALSPQPSCRPPPVAPPLWAGPVVCSQPLRSLSPPDGLENPAEERPSGGDGEAPAVCDHQSPESNESSSAFCFDTRTDVHKRCPLCEVIFPPHFEQCSFERHVESHWRECPVCSEQFPLDCQQHLYEKHVLTHFDSNVLNFDNFD
ncbi:tax1-binding protein 1 homolog A isoform 1-T2 [Clarias gariepinus]|uniref:tax1-binding protein 1 homolog A n=1 Tax=Clarias gariepinus TaxID=13013 RepID=UPI00234C35BD|nr:tax1-binding protein 1 homolog A [Clarias gariepinus]XP_053349318.1 tax1-binding protein 1 homolog A [Clarias gariepinus]